MFIGALFMLQAETYAVYADVNKTANAKHNNANEAYNKARACNYAAFKGRNRSALLVNVHSLHNEQIIIERYYGVYKCNEHKYLEPCTKGTHKDKEFAEKTGKGRYSGKREECQSGYERKAGIVFVEPVERFSSHFVL